mmetsp:Transcript_15292/g.38897  ORF Transcript_15292/g.38897 Transcript_15292/m.38897 type:complete len:582 (+) Transcript_15292:219-1964(+)
MSASDEGDDKLNSLERIFQQKDAVTERNVLDTIRQYVAVGGKPQTVVEMLSESYVGYGPMVNIVLHWLKTFGSDEADQNGRRGVSAGNDCVWKFMSRIVKENFDPNQFSDVFSSGGEIPGWLQELIEFREGRQLIYDLTDQYRSCLFLNFAVHHILQQGFDKEVAAVGGSISGNFNVFNRLFMKKLEELYKSPSTEYESVSEQLFKMCCADEVKYVYSRLILSRLFDTPNGTFFKRLAQQLEQYTASNAGLAVWKMKGLFLSINSKDGSTVNNPKNTEAAFCICSILRSECTVSGDLQKLSHMYNEESGESPPSWELLECPLLLEKLVTDIFAPKRVVTQSHRDTIIDLLCLTVHKNDVSRSKESIEAALNLGIKCIHHISSGGKLSSVDISFLDVPIVSIGVTQWLKSKMLNPEFYETGSGLLSIIGVFISEILDRQELQRADILDLIGKTLPVVGNSLHNFSLQLMDHVASVLCYGEVSLFCSFCRDLVTQQFDRSLTRHLIVKVLQMAAPPYSALFASAILKLVTASGMESVSLKDKYARNQQSLMIMAFLAACMHIDFGSALSKKEEELIASAKALQ